MHSLVERSQQRAAQEEGSIIIALLVIMVGTAAVLAVMSSVVSGLGQVRTDQSRSNAFQYANAGIDHALYRVDSGDFVGASFTDSLSSDGIVYEIEVTQDPIGQDTVWEVRSTGTDPSGKQRLAIANIEATPTFANGFFTINEFVLTGNQNQVPVAYDSSVCPLALASCELKDTSQGRLGTNDKFEGANATMTQLIEQWPGGFAVYGSPTLENAQSRCFPTAAGVGRCHTATPPGTVHNEPEALVLEVPAVPATTQPCPTAALGGTGQVPPGDYLCTDVNLDGVVSVGPGAGDARIWVTGELSASSTAVVNRQERPQRIQFYMEEKPAGYTYSGSICGAELWAVMMTPDLPVKCNGSHQPTIYGVVVANLHDGTGNHLDFHWDVSTRNAFNNGEYHVYNWRECPVGAVDC